MAYGDAVAAPMRHGGRPGQRVRPRDRGAVPSVQFDLDMLSRTVVWQFNVVQGFKVDTQHAVGFPTQLADAKVAITRPLSLAHLDERVQLDVAQKRA